MHEHLRQFLHLLTLFGRHRVEHVLSRLHLTGDLLHQFIERLRVLWKELAVFLHELFELFVFAIVVAFNHLVQRLHHLFHALHVFR